jgi:PAS domain S-box-containing protein
MAMEDAGNPSDVAGLTDEARFRLLVQAVTDYAIYMLDPNGIVSSWNPGAERFKGYSADEIIGQHFSRFYTEEDRLTDLPKRALATAAAEGRFEHEGWRVRKDGSKMWAHVVIDPIRGDDGHLIGFAKITRDITERRNAQLELEEARAALFQSQKMEALGSLCSGVAHDFNNLLTVVLGNLDLLRRASNERKPRLIDNATSAVEQGRKLTQQLLAFGRRQTLRPEVVDVNGLILGMDDMLKQSLRGDITVRFELADGLWPVEVDPSQLQIALINLAVNARDAMPKGGEFRIRTENVTALGGELGQSVSIAVSDTGCGMTPEVIARAFEPFFSTKAVGKGSGLGLPQVYGFAQQSAGTVRISSEIDVGSTFTLSLPRSVAAVSPPEKTVASIGDRARMLRVLLVEDNADVAEVARSVMIERGHNVVYADCAAAAIVVLDDDPSFDIVFSDLVMPGGMDGFDLARHVRDRCPQVPVLLATGYSDRASRALAEGFPLISKPYEPTALLLAIERIAGIAALPTQADNVIRINRGAA